MNAKRSFVVLALAASVLVAVTMTACSGGGGGSSPTAPGLTVISLTANTLDSTKCGTADRPGTSRVGQGIPFAVNSVMTGQGEVNVIIGQNFDGSGISDRVQFSAGTSTKIVNYNPTSPGRMTVAFPKIDTMPAFPSVTCYCYVVQ